MPVIFGINPVLEALQSQQSIEKIYIQAGRQGAAVPQIYRLAKNQKIPVVRADRKKIDALSNGGKHQGVVALLPSIEYTALENLIEKIFRAGNMPNLLLLDRVQDPHNLGAIIRSAEVLGAQGVVVNVRDSAPITDVVVKASAGAVFHLDICKADNLVNAVRFLRDSGVWIYSSSSHSEKNIWQTDFNRPVAVIIGSEGAGVRQLLLKESDDTFRIPQVGKTESLNASVAAGVILTEILRQRVGN
jgi:23S rRNA (guanosine2251-2'-O)-methyltransferase